MVVHVGICAHRISRDLWLKDHHKMGMRRKCCVNRHTEGKVLLVGWLVRSRNGRFGDEEFSLDQSLVGICWSSCPILGRACEAKVFLAASEKLFNRGNELCYRQCFLQCPSSRSRSDQVVAGVAV